MYFYLVECDHKNLDFIEEEYIHIKAKTDCSKVGIMSGQEIIDENATKKTQEELQIIIDDWIDVENENPIKDVDNNDIFQDKINIEKFKGIV